jgi:putative transposase
VEGANRHDMKLVRATITILVVKRPSPTAEPPQGMCLDKGYDSQEVREIVEEFGFTAHIRSRGEAAQAIKPRRARRLGAGWWSVRTRG